MNLKSNFPATAFAILCMTFLFGCEKANSPANEATVEGTPADPSAEATAAVTLLADHYYSARNLQFLPVHFRGEAYGYCLLISG
ncbi:hypothetical protein ACFL07_08725 [Pseudomonadota bacterium]